MLTAPNLRDFAWLIHGFGMRDSVYPAGIATVRQIHSAVVVEAPGSREADALVTCEPGRLVGVRTADCVPVLIACSRTHAVAAIHAGWRGTEQRIAGVAVSELITRYGARAEDLHAAIGPAIGPCCYEVSSGVASRFEAWVPETTHLDLPAINEMQLAAMGIKDIWKANECTFCEAGRYFSFRREKEQAGRMLSFIGTVG
jgi:polyphenol oxidase